MARTLVIASQSTKQTLKLEDTQTIGFVARIQKPPYGYLFGIALPPNDGVSCPPIYQTQPNFTLRNLSKNRAAYPEPKAGQLNAGLGITWVEITPLL